MSVRIIPPPSNAFSSAPLTASMTVWPSTKSGPMVLTLMPLKESSPLHGSHCPTCPWNIINLLLALRSRWVTSLATIRRPARRLFPVFVLDWIFLLVGSQRSPPLLCRVIPWSSPYSMMT
ncbi:hypothetical protein M758_UG148900 [Ceratodon purpureus]|nr:hypothetical protein M758_UG148900 [Ceratodon purpureus]